MSVMANDLSCFGTSVQSFDAANSAFQQGCENLLSDMRALQGMWTGEAHDALMASFEADYGSLGTIVTFMSGMRNSLQNAQKSYEDCERQVSTAIDNLDF